MPIPVPDLTLEISRQLRDYSDKDPSKGLSYIHVLSGFAFLLSERLLLGLRLIKVGSIWPGFSVTAIGNCLMEPGLPIDLADEMAWYPHFKSDPFVEEDAPLGSAPYQITPEVATRLVQLWPLLTMDELRRQKLDLPIRRFHLSFSRNTDEDRFIDQWIALEALIGTNESEMTHKMSQRLAQFIGEDAQDRWNIFDKTKKSYGVRCKIVHGSLPAEGALVAFMDQTEDFLRRALNKCMDNQKRPDKRDLSELDRLLFLQGAPD